MVNVFIVRAVLNTRTYIFVFSYRVLRTMFVLLTQLVCVCVCGGGEECNSYVFFFTRVSVRAVHSRNAALNPSSGQNALFYRYHCSSDRHWPRAYFRYFTVQKRIEVKVGCGVVAHLLPAVHSVVSVWGVWKSIPVRHCPGDGGEIKKKKKRIRRNTYTRCFDRFQTTSQSVARPAGSVNVTAVKGGRVRLSPRAGFMDDVLDATNGPGAWRPWFLSHAHPGVLRTVKTFSYPPSVELYMHARIV